MKKVLLVYVPFCTPASPPYSLTRLCAFLKNNSDNNIEVLDLNLEFHKLKFFKYQTYYQSKNWQDYEKITKEYNKLTKKTYSENNKKVILNEKPEFFHELLNKIKEKKPEIIAFSIVYSSQSFYANALLKELKEFVTIVGGPAVNTRLIQLSTTHLKNELELLEFINEKKTGHDNLNFSIIPDFSIYNLEDYFVPEPVIPLKTCSTCYYQKCTFCTHFAKVPYHEFSLDDIEKTILKSKQKYFFLIDDMIHPNRLLKLAEVFKKHKIFWGCQLRPTKNWSYTVLQELKNSGLSFVIWGVESGCDRILKLMKKGTNKQDLQKVLQDSKKAGIINITYVMFGFPTETKNEFLETINLLEKNEKYIDLISPAIFGLQQGSFIYENPGNFGVINIVEEKRTILEPKISYNLKEGLTKEEITKLKKQHNQVLKKINKIPDSMNFFREHVFFY